MDLYKDPSPVWGGEGRGGKITSAKLRGFRTAASNYLFLVVSRRIEVPGWIMAPWSRVHTARALGLAAFRPLFSSLARPGTAQPSPA